MINLKLTHTVKKKDLQNHAWCKGYYLTEVGSIDLCLHNLWSLGCFSVAVLLVHPLLFVQTLRMKHIGLSPMSKENSQG